MNARLGWLILRQVAIVFATFFGLILVTFVIGRVMPLDPVTAAVGPDVSQELYDKVYKEMGLDQPVLVQFLDYVGSVLRLEFGRSFFTNQPVTADIARVFPGDTSR